MSAVTVIRYALPLNQHSIHIKLILMITTLIFFNDTMCDTLTTAETILSNCDYVTVDTQSTYDNSFSTFYFHNIDGYKSNFPRISHQHKNP